jgi:hypothetical protein
MVSAGGCGTAATPIAGSVPVSGAVTFNGQPLEQGMVRFAPEVGCPSGWTHNTCVWPSRPIR